MTTQDLQVSRRGSSLRVQVPKRRLLDSYSIETLKACVFFVTLTFAGLFELVPELVLSQNVLDDHSPWVAGWLSNLHCYRFTALFGAV